MYEHEEARYIVSTLTKNGYVAYYAGGWVRDFLLNLESDDIDIATNATPETIQSLFNKTIPIGISFGIILVVINNKQYEVATFRRDLEYKDGRRPTKIAYATAQEDASRRDFTINGMFYDPICGKVIDFVDGQKDLEKRIVRSIGNPHERIKEDRLRMIRAVRLACRFNFAIDLSLEDAIYAHVNELFPSVAIERVSQEFMKMANYPSLRKALVKMHDLHLLQVIFPQLKQIDTPHLDDRLKKIDDFPRGLPLIAYINELFVHITLEDAISLVKYLKLSNTEMKFIIFLFQARQMYQHPQENYEWAHFYAHPFSDAVMHILAAEKPIEERTIFLQDYESRKNQLHPHIVRIQTNTPLLQAKDLIQLNVKPGVLLGKLLKKAEEIAINENIVNKNELINRLKQTNLWPPNT